MYWIWTVMQMTNHQQTHTRNKKEEEQQQRTSTGVADNIFNRNLQWIVSYYL